MKYTIVLLLLVFGCKPDKAQSNIQIPVKPVIVCNKLGQYAVEIGEKYLGLGAVIGYRYRSDSIIINGVKVYENDYVRDTVLVRLGREIGFKNYSTALRASESFLYNIEQERIEDSVSADRKRKSDSIEALRHLYKICK